MIDTVPPAGHFADCTISLLRTMAASSSTVGTAGIRQRHQPRCIARSPRPRWRRPSIRSASGNPTPRMAATIPALTAAPASLLPARATQPAAENLAAEIKAFRGGIADSGCASPASWTEDAVVCGRSAHCPLPSLREVAHASKAGRSSRSGNSPGSPRSVAFNVQGFRVAVNKVTGEIKILKSVQAADAGRVANPMQCRGQVEGGVAQSLGAALYEEMVIDEGGRVINPKFRDYHLPSFADIPRTEVFFADTIDTDGPDGRRSR